MYMYYFLGFRLWGQFGETVKRLTGESQQLNENSSFEGHGWLERRTRLKSRKRKGDAKAKQAGLFEDLREGVLEQVSLTFTQ